MEKKLKIYEGVFKSSYVLDRKVPLEHIEAAFAFLDELQRECLST